MTAQAYETPRGASYANMNIVTSANHDFVHCLAGLVESVRRHYGIRPIVYDVGLTSEDRAALDADIVPIETAADCFDFASSGKTRFIKTTHKPACVRHYWQNHDEPMIFIDADCLFAARVEETGFDVGVTVRTGKSLDLSDHFNGVINAGVLFFNTDASELVDAWAAACTRENTTDQKALTDILSETIDWAEYGRVYDWRELKVKVFRTDEYNDYRLGSGKILHLKGLRHEKGIYEQLLAAGRDGRDMYAVYHRLRRKKKGAVWAWLARVFGTRR